MKSSGEIERYIKDPVKLKDMLNEVVKKKGQTKSSEILADKFVALALRPNRIKNRDLWDIVWLNQQGINLPVPLVLQKVTDRRQDRGRFLEQLQQRTTLLQSGPAGRKDFLTEMRRFLPPSVVGESLEKDEFWTYLVGFITDECERVRQAT